MTGDRHPPVLVSWALVAVAALSWGFGSYPLMDQDEGRNGEVAREMAASNDYVLPRLNGLPYVDKPVLWFAATAAVMEALGPTEVAARSVSFLCALATAVLVGICGARWFGREAGWVAGIATATAPLPLAFSRIAIVDSLVALLVTSAILAFHCAVEARTAGRPSGGWTVTAWAAIALGVLTKGPVALIVPLLAAAPYAAWRRASFAVWNPVGPIAMTAIVGPWVGFVEARLPGYLDYVAVTETWQRVASDELHRTQPWWYFGVVASAGFFPWWPFIFARRRPVSGPRDPKRVLLWLWLILPLIMFSLSRSKLPQYILPLMPAVALLIASRWSAREHTPRSAVAVAVGGWLVLGAAFTAAAAGALTGRGLTPALAGALTAAAPALAVVCLLAVVWTVLAVMLERRPTMVAALSLPLMALPALLHPAIAAVAEHRSERALATFIRTELPDGTEVVGLETWRPSLSFYLRRPVPILTDDGDELRSNYIERTHRHWLDSGGTLRSPPTSFSTLGGCDSPRLVLVHPRQPALRQRLLGAGLEPVVARPKLIGFMCRPPTAATAGRSRQNDESPASQHAPAATSSAAAKALSASATEPVQPPCVVISRPGCRRVTQNVLTPL